MTDNEIIKVLQELSEYSGLKQKYQIALQNALDLINRQKAEIEQWKEEANRHQSLWLETFNDIQATKAEAIKEFAEKIKANQRELFNYIYSNDGFGAIIDKLLEETVEEENA